jgi:hypothetical protein
VQRAFPSPTSRPLHALVHLVRALVIVLTLPLLALALIGGGHPN